MSRHPKVIIPWPADAYSSSIELSSRLLCRSRFLLIYMLHMGIVRMKGMARSFVFWPGIDADIERVSKSCIKCAKQAYIPPKFRDYHWEYPKGPWKWGHIDCAGPVVDVMLFIVVDTYSKWFEVKTTASMTSIATIGILEELFAAYGTPITIVSDNWPQFTSSEFADFLMELC